jgi:pyruvate-formate lyase-activating enzyme
MEAHRLSRTPFGLPATVPSDPTGVICTMCVNMCSIPDIASLNTAIPYALLAFSPQFFMNDLPYTPRALADRCLAVTQEAGLERVRIGNVHLLS